MCGKDPVPRKLQEQLWSNPREMPRIAKELIKDLDEEDADEILQRETAKKVLKGRVY